MAPSTSQAIDISPPSSAAANSPSGSSQPTVVALPYVAVQSEHDAPKPITNFYNFRETVKFLNKYKNYERSALPGAARHISYFFSPGAAHFCGLSHP